jgi:hypothetical protein
MIATTDCRDVSEWLAATRQSNWGLTERALFETHLARCGQCRHHRDQLRQAANLHPRGIWNRAQLAAVISRALKAGRLAQLLVSLRRQVHLGIPVAVTSAILALVASGIYVINRHHDPRGELARTGLETLAPEASSTLPAVDPDNLPEPSRPGLMEQPVPTSPVAQQSAPASSAPYPAIAKPPPVPVANVPPGQKKNSVSDDASVTPSTSSVPEAEPPDSWPAAPTDVIGLLRVTDRASAWRDLVALLVRLEGTDLGGRRDFTFIALVPQARYGEFAEALTRIGAWRVEAGRSPLPEEIRITIRLSL